MRGLSILMFLCSSLVFMPMSGMELEISPLGSSKTVNVYETNGLDGIRKVLSSTDIQSLVLFDVDDTLVAYKDPFDRGYAYERKQANTIEALESIDRKVQGCEDMLMRKILISQARKFRKVRLVDQELPTIIKELHQRKVPTIAITSSSTGRYGQISACEDWRLQELGEFGIDFSSSFSHVSEITFDGLCRGHRVPKFKNGILFTGHSCSKGELVCAFMRAVGIVPRNIVFIDDQEDNLLSVYKAVSPMGIPCTLIRYIAGLMLTAVFNKQVAEFQLKYLVEHNSWLTGKQAQEYLVKSEKEKPSCLVQ